MPGFFITGNEAERNAPDPLYEVGRAHRWKIRFDDSPSLDEVTLYAKTCGRPSMDHDIIKMHNQHNEIYMPGKYKWAPIEAEFYDVVLGEFGTSSRTFFQMWTTKVINYIENIQNGQRANIRIDMLDGEGGKIDVFELYGAWPQKISPSNLDYASTELATVKVTFVYNGAYFTNSDYGVTR